MYFNKYFILQIYFVLETVCNIAPAALKTECVSLVDQFGPTIIELLIKDGGDPKKVCTAIKICPASK